MVTANGFSRVLAVCGALFVLPMLAQAQSVVFPKGCLDCHGAETKYPVRGVRSQYLTSGHRTIGDSSYANGEECQKCHTHEGFVEFVKTGKIDPKKVISNPSEIGCFTCHAPHETGNFSLRKISKVTIANGAVFDKGKGNLCASCHQARVTPKQEVRARAIMFGPWGAHHGPQSDMLLGTNAYEFAGKKYSASAHAILPKADCVTCHMTQPTLRYALAPWIGGHSMKLEGEIHEEQKINPAGCLTSGCHSEMKQVPGKPLFDKSAAADYDGDGKIETVQEEVQGLLERLKNKQGTGLFQTMKDPIYNATGEFIVNKVVRSIEVVAALYDYKFVLEDGSRGVHNTKYAVQLLMDAIKTLDQNFDDSKRPE
jgi:hypothetical protein